MAQEKPNGMSVINNHISNNEFSKVYLLYGPEKYLVSQYRDKLVNSLVDTNDSMNYMVFKKDTVKPDDIASYTDTLPFFADRRVVEIHGSNFFKNGNDSMEEILSSMPDTTTVVFVEENVDKRTKLYKTVDKLGTVAVFDTPDEKTLLVWVKSLFTTENYTIEDAAVYRLVEGVGADMTQLVSEAEKLKSYCIEEKLVTVEAVEKLCVDLLEGKIFDMMDALSRKDGTTTMKLYKDLLELREPAMRILFHITRQYNILLKTKLILEEGGNSSAIAKAVKIPPFTVKKYIEQCRSYTVDELMNIMNSCQQADTDIKTGVMRDGTAVEMLIFNLLR